MAQRELQRYVNMTAKSMAARIKQNRRRWQGAQMGCGSGTAVSYTHLDVYKRQAPADALKKLEEKWLDKLQPYGDRGYN